MLNWKGIVVGTLVYVVVDFFVTFGPALMIGRPAQGVIGIDFVSYFRTTFNPPMFLIGMLVFWSLASKFFQHMAAMAH